jgi:hypothetical protein
VDDPSQIKDPYFLLTIDTPTSILIQVNRDVSGSFSINVRKMMVSIREDMCWEGINGSMEVSDILKAGVYAIRCKSPHVHGGSFYMSVFSQSKLTLSPAMGYTEFRKAETKHYDAADHYWKDPDFPAEFKSISGSPDILHDSACWLRPRDMAEVTDPCLFLDGTDKNDPRQGHLGRLLFLRILFNKF